MTKPRPWKLEQEDPGGKWRVIATYDQQDVAEREYRDALLGTSTGPMRLMFKGSKHTKRADPMMLGTRPLAPSSSARRSSRTNLVGIDQVSFDAHVDLGYAVVATPPSPATSGTTLAFLAGAVLPASTPFNAWVCPVGVAPTPANSECIRVTGRSNLQVTSCLRAQEGSSARAIVAGDQVIIGATAKTFTDIESAINAETARAEGVEATLATLASPTFTGAPLVPTAARGTSTTQAASTAYVLAALLSGTAMLKPSGDATGVTDAAVINASLIANATTILDTGNWYVTSIGMVTNARVLNGSGPATVINTLSGGVAITVTGAGQLRVSNMAFVLASGSRAFQINGCYDSTFENLWMSGSSAAGGVKINGDLALEQNWVNVVMRGVGGNNFEYDRTTSIYTGSLYLDRVRCVQPPAGATGGFVFTSSAGAASLNTVTMNECVADNFQGGDAGAFNNVAQVFVTDSWFAVNSSATGKVALRITGGFQHSYKGNYTYTGLASGTCVVVTGAAQQISIGSGHIFDGNAGATAVSVSGLTNVSGLKLGDYQMFGVTLLTDTPLLSTPVAYTPRLILPPADELMVPLKAGGELTMSRTLVSQNAISMTKGQILFGPAQIATVTEAIGHIASETGSTAASGTPTYAGYAVYSVDPATGNLTLVAGPTTTSATLWDVSFQGIGGINVKVAITFAKVAGTMYCVAKLFAGGAGSAPQVAGTTPDSGDASSNLLLPFRGAVSTATNLTALPGTFAFSSMTSLSYQPYDVLLP